MLQLLVQIHRAGLSLSACLIVAGVVGFWPVVGGKSSPAVAVVATLKGHTEAVSSVAFSPDGKRLITGSFDHTLKLWDVAHAKEIKTFGGPQGHKKMVLSVAFSPNGKIVASGGADNLAYLWDVPMPLAASAPAKGLAHPNLVGAVAFDPAGSRLATGCHDGKLRIFDLAKGSLLKEINAHPAKDATMIYAVAWSPDGKQVVSAGFDNSVKLWDAAGGAMIREFKAYKMKEFEKGHRDSVLCVAFSPEGKYLASGSGGLERVIKIWKVADGSVVRDLDNPKVKHPSPDAQSHPGWVYNVRFTRDGKRLVSAGGSALNKGYLAMWDLDRGGLLYGEEMPLGTFYAMAVAPDDTLLAVGAGARGRSALDLNLAYLLRMPGQAK